jgi:hypothetical protein
MNEPLDEPLGSAADEAAKLFGAVADWARGRGEGFSDLADTLGGLAHEVEGHVATGAEECQWCPVCRGIQVVRSASPEVREHLATAVTSLAQAATAYLTTVVPDRRDQDVEHIDLTDDWPPEDEP